MSHHRVKNLSTHDVVDSGGNTNMASSVTPTLAVHHRCITTTAFGGALRNRRSGGTAWLSQNWRYDEGFGEESGLQVC
jgi:hypothetical protein